MSVQIYNKQTVQVGLYTEGNEYQTTAEYSGESYIGYYHIQDGFLYTDPAPIDYRAPLYPYVSEDNREVRKYNIITGTKTPDRDVPQYHFPRPTYDNISQGWMLRYFVQRVPDRVVTEISAGQYNMIGTDKGIDAALYRKGTIRWKITGTNADIRFINSGKLQTLEFAYPGISNYFNNLLEFSEFAPIWAK